jgi:hypothetical protein
VEPLRETRIVACSFAFFTSFTMGLDAADEAETRRTAATHAAARAIASSRTRESDLRISENLLDS